MMLPLTPKVKNVSMCSFNLYFHNIETHSWNILLHISRKSVRGRRRTELRVALCIIADHLGQDTTKGADNVVTALRYLDHNLSEKEHLIILSSTTMQWKKTRFVIFFVPCRSPWVRSRDLRLRWWHSEIQLHTGIHTYAGSCTVWPLDEKINGKEFFNSLLNTVNMYTRIPTQNNFEHYHVESSLKLTQAGGFFFILGIFKENENI